MRLPDESRPGHAEQATAADARQLAAAVQIGFASLTRRRSRIGSRWSPLGAAVDFDEKRIADSLRNEKEAALRGGNQQGLRASAERSATGSP